MLNFGEFLIAIIGVFAICFIIDKVGEKANESVKKMYQWKI